MSKLLKRIYRRGAESESINEKDAIALIGHADHLETLIEKVVLFFEENCTLLEGVPGAAKIYKAAKAATK